MKEYTIALMDTFFDKWPQMRFLHNSMKEAVSLSVASITEGGKILVCGNGGSAADSEHIAGELLKEFYIRRPVKGKVAEDLIGTYGVDGEYLVKHLQGSIPAISLVSQTGFLSAYANDAAPELSFAQEVLGYGNERDILIALSTSGNAKNVNYAAMTAKVRGMSVIAMTGETGGHLKDYADVLLNVPEKETYLVQELHLPIYHLFCRALEYEIFGEDEE